MVLHKGTDEVTFDVCSISRGNGLLGQLAFPFTAMMQVSPLPLHMDILYRIDLLCFHLPAYSFYWLDGQSHFFHEQLRCMKRIAKSKT